jgi:lipoate-protein ligase A
MVFRLLAGAEPEQAASGAWNMALDSSLLDDVARGAPPVLRLYGWSPPCLSFGRNQPARGLFDAGLAARRGIDLVRRPTGGLAVLHDAEVTYAVVVPAVLFGGPRRAYAAINRALVLGLRQLGVDAAADTSARVTARAPALAGAASMAAREPCFRRAAPGEVVAGGRKLVGSAQRCERHTILQHGSVLLDGDQSAVLALQGLPPARSGEVTLRELLGSAPDAAAVQAALVAGFEQYCGTRLARVELTRGECERAGRLVTQYRSDAWTWRR